jgi:hypothetical protein
MNLGASLNSYFANSKKKANFVVYAEVQILF